MNQHGLPTTTHANVYTETRKSCAVSAASSDFNLLPLPLSGVHRNTNMRRENVFLLMGNFNIFFGSSLLLPPVAFLSVDGIACLAARLSSACLFLKISLILLLCACFSFCLHACACVVPPQIKK